MKIKYPALLALFIAPITQANVFINEIHYDNDGSDVSEAIEVAGTAGTDLSGMSLVLYNGSNNSTYATISLSGVISEQQGGMGTISFAGPSSGIQNGAPDGVALVDANNNVVQFLTYEGVITAADGPAMGLTSEDIGVSETSSTPVGYSLQLMGNGSLYTDFTWADAATATMNAVNNGQTFSGESDNDGGTDSDLAIISGSVCTNCPDLEKYKDSANFNAADYYAAVQTEIDLGSSAEVIKAAINSVISSDIKSLTYGEVWTALTYTDEDPENTDNIILWYTARSQAKSTNGSGDASNDGDNWNREHSWPKSHGFPDDSQLAYTDIHHLRASDISVNSSRSNLDFDNSDSPLAESPSNRIDSDSFEPRDDIKGDVARMMFYMDTRYEGAGSDNLADLVLVNRLTTSGEPNLGFLCTLIAWNNSDAVDESELRRNERIYELQGNRNPFIDNPSWVATLYSADSCDTTGGDTGGGDTGGDEGDTGGDSDGNTGTGESSLIFINEIHYDNASSDVGEAIEIAGLAGTDLSGMSLVLYNGSSSQLKVYDTIPLAGVLANQQGGFGTLSFDATGIQNGAPDGIALVDADNNVLQFLSYEGSFTAVDGPAMDMTSTDIGVEETSSTAIGESLQLVGSGFRYQDFTWQAPSTDSFANINQGQTFVAPSPFINEIHYDNASGDIDEAVEIAGLAGTDLSGMSLVLYNGSSSQLKVYDTISLTGIIPNQQGGFGTLAFDTVGIQNGSPDGIAFVDANNVVIQFLSYEGTFTPIDGPAVGILSVDIGVEETSTTDVGFSLQLSGSGVVYDDFTWQSPATSTLGLINNEQTFGAGGETGGGDSGGNETVELGQCADSATLISVIQGNSSVSPVIGEEKVVEAIVTAAFPSLSGFFMQEEAADSDNDSQTSEGVFVYYTGTLPAVGAVVRVVGTVEEYYEKTQLNVTTAPLDCGTGSIVATSLSLPFADGDAPESLEGMFVTSSQALIVSDNYSLGSYGEVTLSNGRLYNPTNLYSANSQAAQDLVLSNALNRIILDDGVNGSNPADIIYPTGGLSASNTLRGGDTVSLLTGVVDFSFSEYRVIPTEAPTFAATNPRTAEPEVALGNLKVASLNVLNYFTTLDLPGVSPDPRGADSIEEFERQRAKTIAAIIALDADVVGLMEIENNGIGEGSALADLLAGINALLGENTYAAVATGGTVGTDQITTALMYKTSKVSLSGNVMINSDSIFNRPPIAQTFALTENGETFTVIVNHFKSKSCGSASGADADQADGQGCYNAKRIEQANALVAWLATDAQLSAEGRQLIIGDLNSYAKEDPILALENSGFTNLIEHFQGADAYSYSFGGTVGYLDHALASADLLAVAVDSNDWHINSDEPTVLDYNTENKSDTQLETFFAPDQYRMSDHDPVVMTFQLDAAAVTGDWDGDGDVDINDVRALTMAIQRRLEIDMAFDLNNDGVVNVLDTRAMMALCTRTRCAA